MKRNILFIIAIALTAMTITAFSSRTETTGAMTAEGGRPGKAGGKYIDVTGTWEGKTYKLSEYVGKGQYVLVDFWASWCGPCRGEIPYLRKANLKYGGKGLKVVGIAVWDDPADTKKAVSALDIYYQVFSDINDAAVKAYGIRGIPKIILIGPDGTILAEELRGEGIERALKACGLDAEK